MPLWPALFCVTYSDCFTTPWAQPHSSLRMPATRPRAAFEPIAPDFDLKALVEGNSNFSYVDRISCDMIDQQGMAAFEKLVLLHVVIGGKPLVIDGFEDRLDPWTFTPRWLRDNCGEKVENSRNLSGKDNLPLTLGHYLNNMRLLTNQFFEKPGAYKEKNKQRVYLKDIDCPAVWWDKLKEHIPGTLAYLNDSTGDVGGPGSVQDGRRQGKGIAHAGDLMSSLPPEMRAENLMCYIGHEGTYTPSHREMCASLGQNIMVEASGTFDEDGKPEKPGSSIWFMTETKDRHLVSEYWLSVLGHDIEVEDHFAQVVAWKKAPFSVYVVEQRPGDFILIPPLAPHQVWNRGTRTMKVAWNRTTPETLRMALDEALPRSRIVCRDEQYKNKAMVYYTLQKYASLLGAAQQHASRMAPDAGHTFMYKGKVRQLIKDFKNLFVLYGEILFSEMFNPDEPAPKNIEYLPFDSNVTCAYCRGNIFNRFLSCGSCKDMLGHTDDAEGDPYDVCMECFAMGRSCWCISGLKWVEQFRWKELASKYESWRKLIVALGGGQITDKTPLPLIDERRRHPKKTLAEVCKDQLKRRPFKDMHKPVDEPKSDAEDDEEEIVVGDDGMVKKIKKKRSKAWLKNNLPCHVCCHRHATWKMAFCTTCDRGWCYGSLFRGWDKMPLEIMEDPDWKCPHCLGICFAGACKREGKMQPYEPKGTLLGHDTKKVADVRSVEALVDFSVSNLTWIKDDEALPRSQSKRLSRAKADAQKAKEDCAEIQDDDDDHEHDQVDESRVDYEQTPATATPIDPALTGNGDVDVDSDAYFARRLQQDNISVLPPAAMLAGVPVGDAPVLDGYAPAPTADYMPPPAHMYGHIEENGDTNYPDPYRPGSVEPLNDFEDPVTSNDFGKRKRANDEDEQEDIAMTKGKKSKKPRLSAAGFKSVDLADSASAPPKNEVQRQFGKEKERKALEKAKADGRFIMVQAALKGKKRIVKLSIPGRRLGQLLAAKAAQAAEMAQAALAAGNVGDTCVNINGGSNGNQNIPESVSQPDTAGPLTTDLLKSDIAPKKDQKELYQQRKDDGRVITSRTKKALIPVEKDDNYGHRSIEKKKTTAAEKRPGRKSGSHHIDYEEVDIGSDHEDDELFIPEGTNKRRSVPNYLKARYNGDDDLPDSLPDDFRDRQWDSKKKTKARKSGAALPTIAPIQTVDADEGPGLNEARPPAGKRPSMRPAVATSPHADDDVDSTGSAEEDANLASTQSSASATAASQPPAWTAANKPQTSTPSAVAQKQRQRQSAMDEENRKAKLQALQMMEDASPGASAIPASAKGKSVRFSANGGMGMGNNISLAEGLDDESSDDEVESVPAKRGRPVKTK
jgi:hypothetical protein